jgi:hypothetical protein
MARKRDQYKGYISDYHKLPDLDNYEFKGNVITIPIISEKVSVLPKITPTNIENNFYNFLIKNGEIISLGEIRVIYYKGDYYYYNKTIPEVKKFQTENDAFKYALSVYKI